MRDFKKLIEEYQSLCKTLNTHWDRTNPKHYSGSGIFCTPGRLLIERRKELKEILSTAAERGEIHRDKEYPYGFFI